MVQYVEHVASTDYPVTYSYSSSSSTHAGSYTIKVTGKGIYGGTSDKATYRTGKAAHNMTVKATKASISITYSSTKAQVTAKNVTASSHKGALSYANVSTGSTAQKFTVSKTTGKVTVPRGTKVGTYTVRIKVTAKGDENFNSSSKAVSYKIVVKKAANPMIVTTVNRNASLKTLTSKAVVVAKPMSVTKAQGTVSYTKVSGNANLSIAKTTGKVTVKKGTPKGTHTIRVKVSAAGNTNYKLGTKTVSCKVVVK